MQIEAFSLLLNVIARMEVKASIAAVGIIPLLIKLLVGENSVIVRQASQTLTSLCEVPEYRQDAVDSDVFEALTTGMKQIRDKDARVAISEAIGMSTSDVNTGKFVGVQTPITEDVSNTKKIIAQHRYLRKLNLCLFLVFFCVF